MTSQLEPQPRFQPVPHAAMGCIVSTVGAYETSGVINSSLSQPASAVEIGATHYHSRTLPRPRRNHGVSVASSVGPTPSTRRQIVSSRVSDYLKSLNSMTRSIVLEKEYVEERHGGEWPVMDETLQEDAVDDYFMPADVHAHYGTLPRSRRSSISGSYREPRCNVADESRLYSSTRVMPTGLSQQQQSSQPGSTADTYSAQSPSPPPTYFIPPTHTRLHKNQLSYRSKALRKVMNMPPSAPPSDNMQHLQAQKRDSGLGSDGESPRTSDEDFNPLGFRRNHLRSYSLRHKRGGGKNNSLARSSTRRTNRVSGNDETHKTSSSSTHHSSSRRTPGLHDKNYDDEVDLPDDSLLLDHISPTHKPEQAGSRSPPKPLRYSSRVRRSLRMQPRILVDKYSTEDEEEEKEREVVVIPNTLSRVASNSSTSTAASTVNTFDPSLPIFHNQSAIVLTNLRRAQSEDSIDTTDTESIAPSNLSLLSKSTGILTEDDALSDTTTIRSCITPESLLNVSNTSVKSEKKGFVRSRPQSRRGGSFYQTSTSEFANRRALFKPNMLRNQLCSNVSPIHTGGHSTPSFSRQNTPALSSPALSESDSLQVDRHTLASPRLISPPPSSLALKNRCSSAGGVSITTSEIDSATSPDFLSSPPHTPMVKSITGGKGLHHLKVRSRESQEQKRESGYISSSSESSFAFPARK